jgi:hypothetical protein
LRYARRVEVRAYLRYFDKKPAVCFWTFGAAGQASHVLSYEHLHRLAWYQPGIFFVLSTKLGFLSLSQCLAQKCGGTLFLGVRAS